MRIRTIKPQFFKNDDLAKLPPLTRLLFIGLWGLADREGRLEDRPQRIKAEVLPYDDMNVEAALASLADEEYIVRYQISGMSLIQVTTFMKHQRITGKEAEQVSCFPPPEGFKKGIKRATPKKQTSKSEASAETTGKEGKGKEGNKEGNESADAPVDPASVEVPLLLNTPEFREVWARWMNIRKKSKSRPKTPWPEFFAEQLRWLEKLGSVESAIESVSASIRNGWQGLFEPKESSQRQRPNDGLDPKFRQF